MCVCACAYVYVRAQLRVCVNLCILMSFKRKGREGAEDEFDMWTDSGTALLLPLFSPHCSLSRFLSLFPLNAVCAQEYGHVGISKLISNRGVRTGDCLSPLSFSLSPPLSLPLSLSPFLSLALFLSHSHYSYSLYTLSRPPLLSLSPSSV